jgi:hypothetical protein
MLAGRLAVLRERLRRIVLCFFSWSASTSSPEAVAGPIADEPARTARLRARTRLWPGSPASLCVHARRPEGGEARRRAAVFERPRAWCCETDEEDPTKMQQPSWNANDTACVRETRTLEWPAGVSREPPCGMPESQETTGTWIHGEARDRVYGRAATSRADITYQRTIGEVPCKELRSLRLPSRRSPAGARGSDAPDGDCQVQRHVSREGGSLG